MIRRINLLFRRYSRRIQNSMGDVTRVAKEAIEAPRVVRVFNAQAYEAGLFEEVIEHNRRSHMKLMLTKGLSNPVVQTIAAIGLAGVLYMATVDAVSGQMTVGCVHVVHRRADPRDGAAAPARERGRPAAAGHRGRAEHLRDPRHAARSRGRRPRRSSAPAARSSTATCDFRYPSVAPRRCCTA